MLGPGLPKYTKGYKKHAGKGWNFKSILGKLFSKREHQKSYDSGWNDLYEEEGVRRRGLFISPSSPENVEKWEAVDYKTHTKSYEELMKKMPELPYKFVQGRLSFNAQICSAIYDIYFGKKAGGAVRFFANMFVSTKSGPSAELKKAMGRVGKVIKNREREMNLKEQLEAWLTVWDAFCYLDADNGRQEAKKKKVEYSDVHKEHIQEAMGKIKNLVLEKWQEKWKMNASVRELMHVKALIQEHPSTFSDLKSGSMKIDRKKSYDPISSINSFGTGSAPNNYFPGSSSTDSFLNEGDGPGEVANAIAGPFLSVESEVEDAKKAAILAYFHEKLQGVKEKMQWRVFLRDIGKEKELKKTFSTEVTKAFLNAMTEVDKNLEELDQKNAVITKAVVDEIAKKANQSRKIEFKI